jgi:hypothetical protein
MNLFIFLIEPIYVDVPRGNHSFSMFIHVDKLKLVFSSSYIINIYLLFKIRFFLKKTFGFWETNIVKSKRKKNTCVCFHSTHNYLLLSVKGITTDFTVERIFD